MWEVETEVISINKASREHFEGGSALDIDYHKILESYAGDEAVENIRIVEGR